MHIIILMSAWRYEMKVCKYTRYAQDKFNIGHAYAFLVFLLYLY